MQSTLGPQRKVIRIKITLPEKHTGKINNSRLGREDTSGGHTFQRSQAQAPNVPILHFNLKPSQVRGLPENTTATTGRTECGRWGGGRAGESNAGENGDNCS